MSKRESPVKQYCFTYNREAKGETQYEQLEDFTAAILKGDDLFEAYCYQEETGCNDGKRHIQGFLHLKARTRPSAFKKVLLQLGVKKSIHLEICRGSPAENFKYCSKTKCDCESPCKFSVVDGPVTKGQPAGQGKRNDLAEIKEKIDSRGEAGLQDAWEENFSSMVRYNRGIEKYAASKAPQRQASDKGKMNVLLFLGPTGTGKTTAALKRWPDAYMKDESKWWDGYSGQDTVIFDDFVGAGDLPVSALLRLLDGVEARVQVKGGYKPMVATRFIFTSNLNVSEW